MNKRTPSGKAGPASLRLYQQATDLLEKRNEAAKNPTLSSQCSFQPSLYHAKQGTPHFMNTGAKVHLKADHQEGQKIFLPTGSRSTRPLGKPVDMARIVGSGSDDSYALYPARAAKENQQLKESYAAYCEEHAATGKTGARIAAFGFELGSAVSFLLFTVTFHANLAHNLTRSPEHL